jgi:transcription-repair coupling factor (superfamily II helicase)
MRYSELLQFLRRYSYSEVEQLHQSADFVVRGDTIEWWPVTSDKPVRYHFFGEELEKMQLQSEQGWILTNTACELVGNEIETEHGTIHPGEYIVHPNHGVGIFENRVTKQTLDGEKFFISLMYAGNDRLLFPFDRQRELMPYIGSRHPRLTRLNSKSWQHTKERVEKDLINVARELLTIYAKRQLTERQKYTINKEWEGLLQAGVDFDLTRDQAQAMQDIESDFTSSPYPMDRLVCGDVGFGKTEVALRAAAQVIANGKQVAFIAPTMILAEQHYTLLKKRFATLPITLAHISRLTAGKDKPVIEALKQGSIYILIGTHRILGKDVHFKDLGLLILDEEQKFGVAQKEHLKELRPSIDVLSLSATPIPRTLSMSLSGLRGLSILRTAPTGRLPVTTIVENYSDQLLVKAITHELDRGGQVYVVHNRVQSLGSVKQRIEQLLKDVDYREVTMELAHGQMKEEALAKTMVDFLKGNIEILVASTVVEHGLDSPMANSLIVLHSEWFGLSDLYQLRGRVGRRTQQAFAHFLLGGIERSPYRELAGESLTITETARKRLNALQEADTLGSGWSIALRDLEIRGGGNILGHEQHGSMEAIGLLLYSQLLQEAIGRQARVLGIPLFQKTKE